MDESTKKSIVNRNEKRVEESRIVGHCKWNYQVEARDSRYMECGCISTFHPDSSGVDHDSSRLHVGKKTLQKTDTLNWVNETTIVLLVPLSLSLFFKSCIIHIQSVMQLFAELLLSLSTGAVGNGAANPHVR